MDLERVIAALAPREVVGRAPVEVADLACDTRAVAPGALFFCVRGTNVDGHDLAPQAVEAGAAALVVERHLDVHLPQIVVADSRAAMAVAADVFFGHPTHELEVVGVTGTNGKTTTAFLLYAILAAAGRRPGLLGTIESRVGGERRPVVRTTPEAIDLQLRGRFNVENALGAVAAARLLGIESGAVAHGLEAVRGVPGRFEPVDEGQPFEVIVDYSHTPDSLENALRAARELAHGRVLVVFGAGGDRDREKRPLMGRVASELADRAILTSDNPRSEDPKEIAAAVARGAI